MNEEALVPVNPVGLASVPDLVVIAQKPEEMQAAQGQLKEWAAAKLASEQTDAAELEDNLKLAIRNKWRTVTLKRHCGLARKRVEFYAKVKAALEAGYCIIPNFPVTVFATRTTKSRPKRSDARGYIHNWDHVRDPDVPKTESPPMGAGTYVKDQPFIHTHRTEKAKRDDRGNELAYESRWNQSWEAVDFPFSLAKPRVLDATATAMAARIFDDLGVLPGQNAPVRGEVSTDPMVIGRIVNRVGPFTQHTLSFLVAWFIDTKAL